MTDSQRDRRIEFDKESNEVTLLLLPSGAEEPTARRGGKVANAEPALKSNSALGKVQRDERLPLAFVFVSREQDPDKAYHTRATARTVETGGTRTQRASESTWRLFPSADLNQVFTQTFTRAGFEVNEASLIERSTGGEFKVSMVENDYKVGNDLQSTTMKNITQGMMNAQIPYMALGTLDVSLADTDPSTSMRRVAVTVNARVLDVTQTIPDTIASVGPVQYAGVGPTEAEARTNALNLAANNAARELTAQIAKLGPLATMAQMPSLKSIPGIGGNASSGSDLTGANDSLVRGYVAANKDVLLANSQMADALGLKDAAAASKATADALTDGATKGNLEDTNKAVSASADAVAAEMAKGPTLDDTAKKKYQAGMAQLGQGVLKYVSLRGPAQAFSTGLKSASPLMLPKLQAGAYVVGQLPTGLSNLGNSMKSATAFAKSNDIPVPPDATAAMAAL